MTTKTQAELAKEAVELWHKRAADNLGQIASGTEGLFRQLQDYADHPSVQGAVRRLARALQDVTIAAERATLAADDIALTRGVEVAADALEAGWVHHIDGDPRNNDLSNLRVVDPRQNYPAGWGKPRGDNE